jgi:hypothetical protein
MLTTASQQYLGTLASAFAVCLTIAFAVVQPQPGNDPATRKTSIAGALLLSFVILLDLAVVAVPLWVLGYQSMGHVQRSYWVVWCGFGGLGVVVLNVVYFVYFALGRSGLAKSRLTEMVDERIERRSHADIRG